jgi:hypothetical protein
MAEDIPTPTLDQTIALSRIGKAHDNLARKVRQGLQVGLSGETIVDFIHDQANEMANRMLREILKAEVIVPGDGQPELPEDDADTLDQDKIIDEADQDTIVISEDDQDTIVIKDRDE